MIRYINLQNYRCFANLHFDLMSKNGIPLKFIVLYGENGSGKSNLIKVFDLLFDSFQTMNIRNVVMNLLEQHPDDEYAKKLSSISSFMDITEIIRKNKMKDSSGDMVIDIGFQLDGKNGSYTIKFDSEQIIYEKLEYLLTKNRGVYFEICQNKSRINELVFGNFKSDFHSLIKRFWGKHSAIAILNSARDDFSDKYITDNFSVSFIKTINYLNSICVYLADNNSRNGIIDSGDSLLPGKYSTGRIHISEKSKLDKTEIQIKKYLKSVYRDITDVFYERTQEDEIVKYNLFFKKHISGMERTIHYSDESCGTKNLISLLPYFISATKKHVVVIDEIDNGIHDILLLNLVKSLYKGINGQLIISTHNTMLLNEYDFKDSFFFIEIDDEGNRSISSPSDYNYRIQADSNVAANYLQGKFHGIPWTEMNIDFNDISNTEHDGF